MIPKSELNGGAKGSLKYVSNASSEQTLIKALWVYLSCSIGTLLAGFLIAIEAPHKEIYATHLRAGS